MLVKWLWIFSEHKTFGKHQNLVHCCTTLQSQHARVQPRQQKAIRVFVFLIQNRAYWIRYKRDLNTALLVWRPNNLLSSSILRNDQKGMDPKLHQNSSKSILAQSAFVGMQGILLPAETWHDFLVRASNYKIRHLHWFRSIQPRAKHSWA